MNTVKLTVTVPRDDFRMIEQEKRQQDLTRSALIQKIVEFFFRGGWQIFRYSPLFSKKCRYCCGNYNYD